MSVIEAMRDAMQNSSSKKTIFALGIVVAVIVILGAITFFFYSKDSMGDDGIDFSLPETIQGFSSDTQASGDNAVAPSNEPAQPQVQSQVGDETANEPSLKSIVENVESTPSDSTPADSAKSHAIEVLAPDSNAPAISDDAPAISQLKYAIKPLDKNIASCGTMENGKWDMPNVCKDDTLNAINALIATNNEIIAIEVSGIVDNSPYSGPSAELKQEGLASFRAREAIGVITRRFSNVAVFEGLSLQAPNKRGFEVKAYYLQK